MVSPHLIGVVDRDDQAMAAFCNAVRLTDLTLALVDGTVNDDSVL
jgi:hypothetical protein